MSATTWWTIQVRATLQAVATQNYACYGRGGVPHYADRADATPRSDPTTRDPATLCVELIIRAPDDAGADPAIRLANLDMNLTPREKQAQRIVWAGYDEAQHLQTIWVWDFFRLLSHVVLRVAAVQADADSDSAPDSAWQHALDGLRAAAAGDTLTLNVRSACGDIHQQHTLTGPAIPWEPAQAIQGDDHGKDQH